MTRYGYILFCEGYDLNNLTYTSDPKYPARHDGNLHANALPQGNYRQMAATVGAISGDRFTLDLGAGERLNEHIVGQSWLEAV